MGSMAVAAIQISIADISLIPIDYSVLDYGVSFTEIPCHSI